MNNPSNITSSKPAGFEVFQLLYFSRLLNRRIRRDKTNEKNGRLTDLVFQLSEPYPDAVGIYIEHGQGRSSEFVPRQSTGNHRNLSYLYIVAGEGKNLQGVVDLRDLVVAPENASLGEFMISPVVSANHDCVREDLVALFAKYQFHLLPVVDAQDRLLGIVRNRDILKGTKFDSQAD